MCDRLIELLDKTFNKQYEKMRLISPQHTAEFLLANGVVVPPCKVGDTVWLIKSLNWQQTEWEIKEGKISMIQQKADKSWKFRVTENHSVKDYTVEKIGKTVFLTREEAEAKLKEGAER